MIIPEISLSSLTQYRYYRYLESLCGNSRKNQRPNHGFRSAQPKVKNPSARSQATLRIRINMRVMHTIHTLPFSFLVSFYLFFIFNAFRFTDTQGTRARECKLQTAQFRWHTAVHDPATISNTNQATTLV
jgi:hypothetical protein